MNEAIARKQHTVQNYCELAEWRRHCSARDHDSTTENNTSDVQGAC